jgi:hypothetical protein
MRIPPGSARCPSRTHDSGATLHPRPTGTGSQTAAALSAPPHRHTRLSSTRSYVQSATAARGHTARRAPSTPADKKMGRSGRANSPTRTPTHPNQHVSPHHHTQQPGDSTTMNSCANHHTTRLTTIGDAPRSHTIHARIRKKGGARENPRRTIQQNPAQHTPGTPTPHPPHHPPPSRQTTRFTNRPPEPAKNPLTRNDGSPEKNLAL